MSVPIRDKRKLGEQIKTQREKQGLSQRGLAIDCEITPQSLSDIEKGINLPSIEVFMRLVDRVNFDDREKIYNLYGELKDTVPPDVLRYLIDNKEIVTELRQKIRQEKGES